MRSIPKSKNGHGEKTTRNKLFKLSLWQFIIAAVIFAASYFFFHFVTDEGITLVWHTEAGKPFVTFMIATLGVLFFFGAVMSLLVAFIFCEKDKNNG